MGLLQDTSAEYYQSDNYGNYQFTSLEDIINQFMVVYVGENKVIPKASRVDVAFHAQRALAELSFDTFKSCKSQEILLPPSLQMILPQDYVNYTKVSWVDSAGIKHPLYPTTLTSSPKNPFQNDDGDFMLKVPATFTVGSRFLVLDKEYSNIQVGMKVISPHTPAPVNVISNVSTDGSITTIELAEGDTLAYFGSLFSSLIAGTITVEIQNADGSMLTSPNTAYTVNNATSTAGGYILTLSASDVGNIEVGMIVNAHTVEYIPRGTKVVAINGNSVTISNPMGQYYATGTYIDINFVSPISDSDTWNSYKSANPSENNNDDYQDDTYWPIDGSRYGLNPQHAQTNGSFYVDCNAGKIHFSSNVSGKTVILDYISDSLGTLAEMQVHKFAEEAMYRWIAHAIISTSSYGQQFAPRFKKEKFAAIRQAKLRLSNIKLEELTQILRGKSKQIKH